MWLILNNSLVTNSAAYVSDFVVDEEQHSASELYSVALENLVYTVYCTGSRC